MLKADKAIRWIRTQHAMVPDKPFFAYYTTGTAQAEEEQERREHILGLL